MTEAGYRTAVGQFEVALRPLQQLDMGLFVHRQHHRAFGRIEIKSYDVGRFGGKLGVGADTPTVSALQVNAVAAQDAPDVMARDVAQGSRQQPGGPLGPPGGRLVIPRGQYPALYLRVVAPRPSPPRRILQCREPARRKRVRHLLTVAARTP